MSMFRDLVNNLKFTQIRASAALTADANSTSVDMQGYDSLTFVAVLGATGDTLDGSNYIDLEIEGSADNSIFVDATDAMLSAAVTGTTTGTFARIDSGTEDSLTYTVSLKTPQAYRYWRVVGNVTGTHTNGTPLALVAIQGRPQVAPV